MNHVGRADEALVSLLGELCEFEIKIVALRESVRVLLAGRSDPHAVLPHQEAGLAVRIADRIISELGIRPLKPTDRKKYLREREVAEYLGVKVTTLRAWRLRRSKNGPPFTRLGRMVLYSVAELERHLQARLIPSRN
jgi:predicted DNA-binding transcriptional regulator AlpA